MTTPAPAHANAAGAVIRRLQAHEWPAYRRLRLRALADAPHAFGSTLALEESWQPALWMARLVAASTSGRDCPLVADASASPAPASASTLPAAPHADAVLTALLWAKCDPDDPDIVNLFQMWVAPEARGLGLGASLVHAAVDWARSIDARGVRLGVVTDNDAAVRLYARAGFVPAGAPAPIRPGATSLEQTMLLDLHALRT